jgi:hypothetical protein
MKAVMTKKNMMIMAMKRVNLDSIVARIVMKMD